MHNIHKFYDMTCFKSYISHANYDYVNDIDDDDVDDADDGGDDDDDYVYVMMMIV